MGPYVRLDQRDRTRSPAAIGIDLSPFVPAVVIDWVATQPDATHRSVRGSLLRIARPDDPARAITSCLEQGGDLLKFLGDEMLFLFTGRNNAERAAEAWRDGEVSSGVFDLFLVGCEHRELFVCGPSSRQIPDARNAGRTAPDLALVRRCVTAIVRADGNLTGRREIVVASLHLSNLDNVLDEEGAATASRHLNDLIHRINRSFAEHDVAFIGSEISVGGPRIVCATGIVRGRTNDDERLVRALREVLDYPSAIDIRVGIDRGTASMRYEGTATRRALTVRGRPVRSATDLMEKAGSSDIVTTSRVIERAGPLLKPAVAERRRTFRVTKPPYLRRGVVNMLLNLGTLASEHHDFTAAKHYFEEALELSRRGGASRDEALALHRLAETALAMRDPELAMVRCDQALAALRDGLDDLATAATLITLGLARSADGDDASATSCWLHAVGLLGGDVPTARKNPLGRARHLLAEATASAAARPSA